MNLATSSCPLIVIAYGTLLGRFRRLSVTGGGTPGPASVAFSSALGHHDPMARCVTLGWGPGLRRPLTNPRHCFATGWHLREMGFFRLNVLPMASPFHSSPGLASTLISLQLVGRKRRYRPWESRAGTYVCFWPSPISVHVLSGKSVSATEPVHGAPFLGSGFSPTCWFLAEGEVVQARITSLLPFHAFCSLRGLPKCWRGSHRHYDTSTLLLFVWGLCLPRSG